MRVGLLGGTFDPIHIGHLLLAEQARDRMQLDQVWFVPVANPPHKAERGITAAHHRWNMVTMAIANHPTFIAKKMELDRGGISYTIDTIEALYQEDDSHQYFLIVGGDSVYSLPSWVQIEQILERVSVIALMRPNTPPIELPTWIRERVSWLHHAVTIYLSSSYLRAQLQEGRSIRYLVPDPVYQYMKEHQLYG